MAKTAHVLFVEDDAAIVELVRYTVERAGFDFAHASSAEQALARINETLPDVLLVDWMLPGMSGLALAQRLRREVRTRSVAMIMLTARVEESDRITGLDYGADDYLTKPFSPRELVARMRAVLRRRAPELGLEMLSVGPLALDPETYTVTLESRRLDLAPTEFRLLRVLMAQPGRVFTRPQLLDKVWGDAAFIEERTVDVHVRRLRVALGIEGESLLETVRGVGYRIAIPAT